MTREEAIKEHERAFDVLDHSCHMDNRRKEAFNMARLALSAEPCEDCISRAELINKTIKRNSIWLSITDSRGMNLQEIIDELPSVQPKPKTDVLDKIKSEIEEVQTYKMFEGEDTVYVERKDVLAIINKYKAGGVDEE